MNTNLLCLLISFGSLSTVIILTGAHRLVLGFISIWFCVAVWNLKCRSQKTRISLTEKKTQTQSMQLHASFATFYSYCRSCPLCNLFSPFKSLIPSPLLPLIPKSLLVKFLTICMNPQVKF